MAYDVWLIHPKMSTGQDDVYQSDRVDVEDPVTGKSKVGFPNGYIGSLNPGRETQLKHLLERWWGGNWPDDGLGNELYLGDNDLFVPLDFQVEYTTRSTPDNVEAIIFPSSMTLAQAELRISPEKTERAAGE